MTTFLLRFAFICLLGASRDMPPQACGTSVTMVTGQDDVTSTPAASQKSVLEISSHVVKTPSSTNDTTFLDGMSGTTLAATVASDWSWQAIPWTWNITLQLCMGLLGALGNLLVIVVLFRRRRVSQSTDTLLGALAAADFLTSVFIIPLPEADRVPLSWEGELYCRMIYTNFFRWWSVSGSIFTLTTIAIERFVAVLFPFAFNRLLRKRHVVLAILMIWLIALIADIFIPLTISVNPDTKTCTYGFPSALAQEATGIISFLIHFPIPVFIMLTTQAFTARALYGQSKLFGSGSDGHSGSTSGLRLIKAKNRVIKLLFIVIVTFIVTWGPNSFAYFLYNIGVTDASYLYGNTNRILPVLALCNSVANPFIYAIQYPTFRRAILELFTCSGHGRPMEALFESNAKNSKKSTQLTTEVSKI